MNSVLGFLSRRCALLILVWSASHASIAMAQSTTLYLPVLQATNDTNVGLALSNPTLSETFATLTLRGLDGQKISGQGITNPATLTLPASGQRSLLAVEIFGTGIVGKTGWVEIVSPTPAVRGCFLVFDPALHFVDGAELTDKPSTRLIFPKVSVTADSETNLNLINTSSSRLTTSLSLFDNSGNLRAKNGFTIEPFAGLPVQ